MGRGLKVLKVFGMIAQFSNVSSGAYVDDTFGRVGMAM